MMRHLYGNFSDNQIKSNAILMHNEIHKLLLHKDNNVPEVIFDSEDDYKNYFLNLMLRYGGLNELLGCPTKMVALLSTLQAAFCEVTSNDYDYSIYRKLILDAHGYVKSMFEEEVVD